MGSFTELGEIILKSRGGGYSGKGKRTGVKGHYKYKYTDDSEREEKDEEHRAPVSVNAERVAQLSESFRGQYEDTLRDYGQDTADMFLNRVAPTLTPDQAASHERRDRIDAAVMRAKKRSSELRGQWKDNTPLEMLRYGSILKEELGAEFPGVNFSRQTKILATSGITGTNRFKTSMDEVDYLGDYLDKKFSKKILKSLGGGYSGKGRRTGVKGHYEYKYDEDSGRAGRSIPHKEGGDGLTKAERAEIIKKYKAEGLSKVPPVGATNLVDHGEHAADIHAQAVISWRLPNGSKQHGYTNEFTNRHAANKWDRVRKLRAKIPAAQRKLRSVMNDPSKPKTARDAAAALLIISKTGLRAGHGGQAHVSKHGTKGVMTIHTGDVSANPKTGEVEFSFTGKSKKHNTASLTDKDLAKYVAQSKRGRGDAPLWRSSLSGELLSLMMDKVGLDGFKPKDFRTNVAAEKAAEFLANRDSPPPKTKREVVKIVNECAKFVSEALNNTPAITKKSYIPPSIFDSWHNQIEVIAKATTQSILEAALAKPAKGAGKAEPAKGDDDETLEMFDLPGWIIEMEREVMSNDSIEITKAIPLLEQLAEDIILNRTSIGEAMRRIASPSQQRELLVLVQERYPKYRGSSPVKLVGGDMIKGSFEDLGNLIIKARPKKYISRTKKKSGKGWDYKYKETKKKTEHTVGTAEWIDSAFKRIDGKEKKALEAFERSRKKDEFSKETAMFDEAVAAYQDAQFDLNEADPRHKIPSWKSKEQSKKEKEKSAREAIANEKKADALYAQDKKAAAIERPKAADKKAADKADSDKKAALKEVHDFIENNTYMDYESNPSDVGYVHLATREHGDVGNETHGQEDLAHARDLKKKLTDKFGDAVEVTVDVIDEWVDLTAKLKDRGKVQKAHNKDYESHSHKGQSCAQAHPGVKHKDWSESKGTEKTEKGSIMTFLELSEIIAKADESPSSLQTRLKALLSNWKERDPDTVGGRYYHDLKRELSSMEKGANPPAGYVKMRRSNYGGYVSLDGKKSWYPSHGHAKRDGRHHRNEREDHQDAAMEHHADGNHYEKRKSSALADHHDEMADLAGDFKESRGKPGGLGIKKRGNPIPKDSNWTKFATKIDIGVLDLDSIAGDMGFRDFEHMEISINPKRLSSNKKKKFLSAVRDASGKAGNMSDAEILSAAGHGSGVSKGDAPPKGYHMMKRSKKGGWLSPDGKSSWYPDGSHKKGPHKTRAVAGHDVGQKDAKRGINSARGDDHPEWAAGYHHAQEKSKKSPTSGNIIGHTSSGKPIYAPKRKVTTFGQNVTHGGDTSNYTKEDHEDAHELHQSKYARADDNHDPKGEGQAYQHMANVHRFANPASPKTSKSLTLKNVLTKAISGDDDLLKAKYTSRERSKDGKRWVYEYAEKRGGAAEGRSDRTKAQDATAASKPMSKLQRLREKRRAERAAQKSVAASASHPNAVDNGLLVSKPDWNDLKHIGIAASKVPSHLPEVEADRNMYPHEDLAGGYGDHGPRWPMTGFSDSFKKKLEDSRGTQFVMNIARGPNRGKYVVSTEGYGHARYIAKIKGSWSPMKKSFTDLGNLIIKARPKKYISRKKKKSGKGWDYVYAKPKGGKGQSKKEPDEKPTKSEKKEPKTRDTQLAARNKIITTAHKRDTQLEARNKMLTVAQEALYEEDDTDPSSARGASAMGIDRAFTDELEDFLKENIHHEDSYFDVNDKTYTDSLRFALHQASGLGGWHEGKGLELDIGNVEEGIARGWVNEIGDFKDEFIAKYEKEGLDPKDPRVEEGIGNALKSLANSDLASVLESPEFEPTFDNKEDFLHFLSSTLIPDYRRSGSTGMASSFRKLANRVKSGKRDKKFEEFLTGTLLPDLERSGSSAATDIKEGLHWLSKNVKKSTMMDLTRDLFKARAKKYISRTKKKSGKGWDYKYAKPKGREKKSEAVAQARYDRGAAPVEAHERLREHHADRFEDFDMIRIEEYDKVAPGSRANDAVLQKQVDIELAASAAHEYAKNIHDDPAGEGTEQNPDHTPEMRREASERAHKLSEIANKFSPNLALQFLGSHGEKLPSRYSKNHEEYDKHREQTIKNLDKKELKRVEDLLSFGSLDTRHGLDQDFIDVVFHQSGDEDSFADDMSIEVDTGSDPKFLIDYRDYIRPAARKLYKDIEASNWSDDMVDDTVPGLKDMGMHETAKDLGSLARLLSSAIVGDSPKMNYFDYDETNEDLEIRIKDDVIPGLKDMDMPDTAESFEEGLKFLKEARSRNAKG